MPCLMTALWFHALDFWAYSDIYGQRRIWSIKFQVTVYYMQGPQSVPCFVVIFIRLVNLCSPDQNLFLCKGKYIRHCTGSPDFLTLVHSLCFLLFFSSKWKKSVLFYLKYHILTYHHRFQLNPYVFFFCSFVCLLVFLQNLG